MQLKIERTEYLAFTWVRTGPNPGWHWKHSSGQIFPGDPLEGNAGFASIGKSGSTIAGSCIAVTMTDIMYQFLAQEP